MQNKESELRVTNRKESYDEYDRRMARDILTEKDPVKLSMLHENWAVKTQIRTIGRPLLPRP